MQYLAGRIDPASSALRLCVFASLRLCVNSISFSFSNSYTRGGVEARVNRWNRMPDYLESVIERLKMVRVEKKDGLALFEDFKNRPANKKVNPLR